jgi:hypothetical protein
MNTSYFVLISVALTFATGFFVASIISSISWLITPKEEKSISVSLMHLFRKSPGEDLNRDYILTNTGSLMAPPIEESENNEELYHYHHGKN